MQRGHSSLTCGSNALAAVLTVGVHSVFNFLAFDLLRKSSRKHAYIHLLKPSALSPQLPKPSSRTWMGGQVLLNKFRQPTQPSGFYYKSSRSHLRWLSRLYCPSIQLANQFGWICPLVALSLVVALALVPPARRPLRRKLPVGGFRHAFHSKPAKCR